MKAKKGALWTLIISAAVAVALLATGIVFLNQVPQNAVLASAEGTITKTARSFTDDSWYYGDSAGNLVKLNEEGEVLATLPIAPGKSIRSISASPHLPYLLVLDEDYGFYKVTDTESGLTKEFLKTFSGGFQALAADGDSVYFAISVAQRTFFYRYDADDLAGEPTAAGQLYICVRQGENYSFDPVVAGTIVDMEADENYLYVLSGEGQYHRMAKDFSLNQFSFLSEEELAAMGAQVAGSGAVTLPRESYDSAKYRTVRSQIIAGSAVYDEREGQFYVAGTDGKFITLDTNFKAVEGKTLTLPNQPATGAIAFHPESGTVYVGYQNISAVTAIDARAGRVRYQSDTAFYISAMTVPESGDRLLVICAGNNKDNPELKELLSVDVARQSHKDLYNSLGIAFVILTLVAAAVCVFAALCLFKRGYRERFVLTVRGMLKSWVVYVIVLGSLSMLILFCYYPGISSMVLSFFDYTQQNPTMRFNNFDNYIQIFTNPANLLAFRNMFIFLVSDIVIALVPPMLFAFCLCFMRFKGYSTFSRIVLFLPTVLPGIATLLIWKRGIYGSDGVLNLLLRGLTGNPDLTVLFLQDYGILSLILMGFPFVGSYLIFYGALMNVPSSYYEAAELDGCSIHKRIFLIDLPMISAQIKYVFILAFIQSVQNFGRVLMTTDGQFGTQIPIVLMYKKLQTGDYGLSSAFATLMFLVLIVVTVFNMKIQTADAEV